MRQKNGIVPFVTYFCDASLLILTHADAKSYDFFGKFTQFSCIMLKDPFGICLVNFLPRFERPGLLTEFWNPCKTISWLQVILEVKRPDN